MSNASRPVIACIDTEDRADDRGGDSRGIHTEEFIFTRLIDVSPDLPFRDFDIGHDLILGLLVQLVHIDSGFGSQTDHRPS